MNWLWPTPAPGLETRSTGSRRTGRGLLRVGLRGLGHQLGPAVIRAELAEFDVVDHVLHFSLDHLVLRAHVNRLERLGAVTEDLADRSIVEVGVLGFLDRRIVKRLRVGRQRAL